MLFVKLTLFQYTNKLSIGTTLQNNVGSTSHARKKVQRKTENVYSYETIIEND